MSEPIFGGTFASDDVSRTMDKHGAALVRVALTNAKAAVPIADAATMTAADFAGSALAMAGQAILATTTVRVLAEETMRGKYDEGPFVRSYLAGLKAGRAEREE